MCVFAYNVDHYAFCWTSTHTHPLSGVINQILSPICNHLHLRCLLYVCLAVWVCVCVWVTYTIWSIGECARACCDTEGVLGKTHGHILTSPSSCNAYHIHTHTHRFMCSLLTVIPAYISHLCSRLCCMLGGVCPCMCACVRTRGVLLRKESLISGWREPKTLCSFFFVTRN